jgi:cell division septation protein DedD
MNAEYAPISRLFVLQSSLLFCSMVLYAIPAFAQQAEKAANTVSRVWLTVEVLEKKPSLGNSSSALNEYIPVVIVDSATSAYLYALSGEMVEVGAERTYFLSVVSGDDKRFNVQGAPVQIVRTGAPVQQDLMYQREFVIKETVKADSTMQVPERIASDTPPSKPTFRTESATISYKADKQQDCPYIVQFCALSLEKDANQIRDALKGASVQDARVESFKDIAREIQYFRVRAGCFTEIMNAKSALESFFKTAQRLKLGVVPIVVKQ